MKKNIFDNAAHDEVLSRIQKLNANSQGLWGKLSAPQMIHHLTEACRMALDEIPMPDRSTLLTRTLFRWLFLNNIKPPGREKGKIKTFPEIDIVELNLPIGDIEKEKLDYAAVLKRLIATENLSNKHTVFGKMSRNDWGHLTYAHADYHLTQFDV
jgi:hypothetical protein